MTTSKAICTRFLGALLGMAGIHLLSPADLRAQTLPPCHTFFEATQWKGTFTLQGTGSGSLADGGTYSINETVTASPFLSSGNIPGMWGGPLNETIHIDDMETHPDGTFTHVTDDETVTTGPIGKAAGFPGAGLSVQAAACTGFEFDFDPSFNATLTTQNGTQTSPGSFGFAGVHQSGSMLLTTGAIQGPLPANGLLLTGSGSVSFLSLVLGDPGTWTLSWTLNPIFDVDLWVTIPTYQSWRPTGGQSETDTGLDDSGQPNLLQIQALLVDKTTKKPVDFVPDNLNFSLVQFSSEPGVSMNWPMKNALSTPDLTFDKSQPKNAKFTISPDGTKADIAPTIPSNVLPTTIYLSPHDWGGWATLNVTATIGGLPVEGHLVSPAPPGGATVTDILLPQRQPGSHVADVWKTQHSVPLGTADSDDSEPDPAGRSDCVGDGFTLYEEYRGFMENGKHIEGDPLNKDFFIVNKIGADAEPGIWLFTQLTRLTVHKDIKESEVQTTKTPLVIGGVPQQGVPRINFNTGQGAFETAQHGVWIRSCNVDGGVTFYLQTPGITEHAKPARDQIICIQERDDPGTINPDNTHHGVITAVDATLQYDVAVAHELLHAVGVLHHGDRPDEGKTEFVFLFPSDPNNVTGKPVFQLQGQDVRILDEQTGQDKADAFWQGILSNAQFCDGVFKNPAAFPSSIVYQCHTFAIATGLAAGKLDTTWPQDFTVGLPKGKHSGNDQCVMRYAFAQLYPQSDDNTIFYQVPDGTEPLGSIICDSPIGTGVNDPNRTIPKQHPQPRYSNARSGRGACESWVCVNDVYAVVADSQ
jgi:hypothetical protein